MMNEQEQMVKIRNARCICGKIAPSTDNLAFFKDRGPGSDYSRYICEKCGYNMSAHRRNLDKNSLICTSFTPLESGHDYDSYYCGCRGWD